MNQREDTFSPSGEQAVRGGGTPRGRTSIDRFEMDRQWSERTEEEQAEAAAELYEKAIRQWMPPTPPEAPVQAVSEEEMEAMSQELRLRQKCQDIAAMIMVDELEDDEED